MKPMKIAINLLILAEFRIFTNILRLKTYTKLEL